MKQFSNTFDFWDKLNYLFSDPNFFFETIKNEKGIKNALLTYSIVGAFLMGVGLLLYFIFEVLTLDDPSEFLYSTFIYFFAFGGLIVGLIITFLYSGLIHALIIAFKGSGNYSDTYKAYTYSMVPSLIISVVPIIGFLSIIYSIVLMVIGISKLHNLSKGKSILACLLPTVLLFGVLAILFFSAILPFVYT